MGSVIKKTAIIFIFLLIILLSTPFTSSFIYSQTDTPTPTPFPERQAILDKINDLQNKISDLKGQEKTLSSQIAVMDNQITLTEYRIEATKEQIASLTLGIDTTTKKISNLEKTLSELAGVLINRIIATYEVGTIQPIQILLTSSNVSNFLSRLNYLRIVQMHDKKLIYDTQQAKNDYTNQKDIFEVKRKKVEALKAQLVSYTTQLAYEKKNKQSLLDETRGDESNYQRLLAQAKAQLTAFQNFAASQGGASLLSGQTSCDDWGCYYNQRDSSWGATSLNNTQYTLASAGCLVTSMAMVLTHYGHRGVTPLTINSNPDNFASYFPAYLKYTISVDGVTAQRVSSIIDSTLADGHPVVVGVSYDGGPIPDHFVVLISGSNGNYKMNDPFLPNGHNVPFNDHYSVSSIKEIDKVLIY